MSRVTYPWKRYCWAADRPYREADGAFLPDPGESPMVARALGLFTLAELETTPCLILVAEPGLGKTTVLREEFERLKVARLGADDACLWIDLSDYESDVRLADDLRTNEQLRLWQAGNHRLYLFLDSLDECRLDVKTAGNILSGFLAQNQQHKHRLFVRLACRTADWPVPSLANKMKELWGAGSERGSTQVEERGAVRALELGRLRRCDAEAAALAEGIEDPAPLLEEIRRQGLEPLASHPLTLGFLLRDFRAHGRLPRERWEVYERGLLALAKEANASRQETGRDGRLTPARRLELAARLAAVQLLANLRAFQSSSLAEGVSDELPLEICCDIASRLGPPGDLVEKGAIREALDTALFASRGQGAVDFAHKTFAEFLAAKFLLDLDRPFERLLPLLTVEAGGQRRVVPQLAEVVAWVASRREAVRAWVLREDPLVLLRADEASLDAETRRALTEVLLERFLKIEELDSERWIRDNYWKLKHADLATQLKPYFERDANCWLAKVSAVDIAKACDLRELQGELLALALKPEEREEARTGAVEALDRLGHDEARRALIPLTRTTQAEDPSDGLRAAALRATWPRVLPTAEMLACLELPRQPKLFGSYYSLIGWEIARKLPAEDLDEALEWIQERSDLRRMSDFGSSGPFERLAQELAVRSVEELLQSNEPKRLVSLLSQLLDDGVFGFHAESREAMTVALDDPTRRRLLLSELVDLGEGAIFRLQYRDLDWGLLHEADIRWALANAEGPGDQGVLGSWMELLQVLCRRVQPAPETLEAIHAAMRSSDSLRSALSGQIEPVGLDSEAARAHHPLPRLDWSRSRDEVDVAPDLAEALDAALARSEAGKAEAWTELWWLLGGRVAPDRPIQEQAAWKRADSQTRARIGGSALRFITATHPSPAPDEDGNWPTKADLAGLLGLCLLQAEAPDQLDHLPALAWQAWAPIVVRPGGLSALSAAGVQELRRKALVRARPQFLDVVKRRLLSREWQLSKEEADHLGRLIGLEGLEALLLEDLGTTEADDRVVEAGYGLLLRMGSERAEAALRLELELADGENGLGNDRALVAAKTLFKTLPNKTWYVVGPWLRGTASASSFLTWIAERTMSRSILGTDQPLDEVVEGDLLEGVYRHFPCDEDPEPFSDGPQVGSSGLVPLLRSSLSRRLANSGSERAVERLRRLADQYPGHEDLQFWVATGRHQVLRSAWQPPALDVLLHLLSSEKARLVRDGAELLDLLVEALGKVQADLQGDIPAAPFLWDKGAGPSGGATPKDEEALSNWLKLGLERELEDFGLLAHREVTIQLGQRADLLVTLPCHSKDGEVGSLKAIIEVKGCWNPEVPTALDQQLAERYLKYTSCKHGIYLVGLFDCEEWDPADPRRKKRSRRSIDELRSTLAQQAAEQTAAGFDVRSVVLDAGLQKR